MPSGEPPEGPDKPDPDDLPDGVEPEDLPPMPMTTRKRRPPAEGEVEVFGVDEQSEAPVELARWVDLATAALLDSGVRGEAELSLLFVEEAVMAELNQRFMGAEGATDVLAFPLEDPIDSGRWPDSGSTGPDREPPETGELPLLLGDVVVCPAVAARQAPEHAGSYDDEIALLVVHGVLHVLGMDHADPEETTAMQARERELLDRYHHGRGMTAVEMSTTDWWIVAAIVLLFLLSILLAVAETALTRVSKAKAQALAETNGNRGEVLLSLVENQEWLNPTLLVVLSTQLVQSTMLGVLAARLFGAWGVLAATIINVTLFFVIAEVAPKTWAIQHTDRAALAAARPIKALAGWGPLRLLSRGLIGLTNVLLPGKGLKRGPYTSEEELLAVADLAVEDSVIEAEERELIESVIELGDTVVREVMVPRTDMVTVTADFRVADAMEVVILNGYSRIPVCGEGIDDVVGILHAKDLMRAERDDREHRPVSELARPAHFVPETKGVANLLREMQQQRFHMAIVVDEYGGTAGLITLEDIIEELLGEIVDEFDVEDAMIEPLPGGDYRVNARMAIDEVNDLVRSQLPEGDWDTIGGLLLATLGHVPAEGEAVEVDGLELTAQRVVGRRIGRVRIHRVHAFDSAPPAANEA